MMPNLHFESDCMKEAGIFSCMTELYLKQTQLYFKPMLDIIIHFVAMLEVRLNNDISYSMEFAPVCKCNSIIQMF